MLLFVTLLFAQPLACIAGGFAIGLGFGLGIQFMMKWLRRQGATSDQQARPCTLLLSHANLSQLAKYAHVMACV